MENIFVLNGQDTVMPLPVLCNARLHPYCCCHVDGDVGSGGFLNEPILSVLIMQNCVSYLVEFSRHLGFVLANMDYLLLTDPVTLLSR